MFKNKMISTMYRIESESEVAQSCPTLCDPMDYSQPGSSIHGIFQARVLDWVAISFWPEEFPLKDQLLPLWESLCVFFVSFPLLFLIVALCV